MKAGLVHVDGTFLQQNLPLQALLSQIEIYFNGNFISSTNNHYPWEAHVKTKIEQSVILK